MLNSLTGWSTLLSHGGKEIWKKELIFVKIFFKDKRYSVLQSFECRLKLAVVYQNWMVFQTSIRAVTEGEEIKRIINILFTQEWWINSAICYSNYTMHDVPYIIRKTLATTEHYYSTDKNLMSFDSIQGNWRLLPQISWLNLNIILFFFFSFLFLPFKTFLFTVWSKLGSPPRLAHDTTGIFLLHELTHLHILSKCTCVRICKKFRVL